MWFTNWQLVKAAWPAFAMMAAVLVLMVVVGLFATKSCSTAPEPPDHLEAARDLITEQLRLEREKNDKKLLDLQEELDALRFQVDIIDAEIAESARQREELHDAIDNAGSIDDIDRILKGGIPARTGGRRPR